MAAVNRVYLMGNLTRRPELKKLKGNTCVADLGVAVNEQYKDRNGDLQDRTCFVDVNVWDRQAETCAEFLDKGSPVFIEGRLQLDSWKDENGHKRNKLKVKADRVQFVGTGDRQGKSGTRARR